MPQLSIVVPAFNEAGNVAELRERLSAALPGIDWGLIFVDDDSPDGTAKRLAALAQQDRRVRCMLRIERRGLSSACGMHSATAPRRRHRAAQRRRPGAFQFARPKDMTCRMLL
jgi:dolichol-phosphate mannosyltransferase